MSEKTIQLVLFVGGCAFLYLIGYTLYYWMAFMEWEHLLSAGTTLAG